MRRFLKLLSVIPVLALGLSACDSSEKLTSPDAAFKVQSPTVSELRATPAATATPIVGKTADADADADVTPTPKFGGLDETTLAMGQGSGRGVATIGADGGTVSVWNQKGQLVAMLVVSRNAVTAPTEFTIHVAGKGKVFLAATRRTYNDIGQQGFNAPVGFYINKAASRSNSGLREGGDVVETSQFTMASTMKSRAGTTCGASEIPPPDESGEWEWVCTESFTGWIIIGS